MNKKPTKASMVSLRMSSQVAAKIEQIRSQAEAQTGYRPSRTQVIERLIQLAPIK